MRGVFATTASLVIVIAAAIILMLRRGDFEVAEDGRRGSRAALNARRIEGYRVLDAQSEFTATTDIFSDDFSECEVR